MDMGDGKSNEAIRVEEKETPKPAQYGFHVWRVNDYDLAVQHNEAVALAAEHLGISRNKADGFFDGALGGELTKIIPFNHPLSPTDCEEVRRTLDARPDESRPVRLICLGCEIAAQAWVADWNRVRTKGSPGYITITELRTDDKAGGVFEHKPCEAEVTFAREGENVAVAISEFVSPTILERLRSAGGVLAAAPADFKAMIDCVLIDPTYDGKVFQVALSDIPAKKTEYVKASYALKNAKGPVAIKIIDMLGEELLIVEKQK